MVRNVPKRLVENREIPMKVKLILAGCAGAALSFMPSSARAFECPKHVAAAQARSTR